MLTALNVYKYNVSGTRNLVNVNGTINYDEMEISHGERQQRLRVTRSMATMNGNKGYAKRDQWRRRTAIKATRNENNGDDERQQRLQETGTIATTNGYKDYSKRNHLKR